MTFCHEQHLPHTRRWGSGRLMQIASNMVPTLCISCTIISWCTCVCIQGGRASGQHRGPRGGRSGDGAPRDALSRLLSHGCGSRCQRSTCCRRAGRRQKTAGAVAQLHWCMTCSMKGGCSRMVAFCTPRSCNVANGKRVLASASCWAWHGMT